MRDKSILELNSLSITNTTQSANYTQNVKITDCNTDF